MGASPNYKDARGLSPLYLSVMKKSDPKICESLLHDHATLGTQDVQGWQEVHQVNRHLVYNSFYIIGNSRFRTTNTMFNVFAGLSEWTCSSSGALVVLRS